MVEFKYAEVQRVLMSVDSLEALSVNGTLTLQMFGDVLRTLRSQVRRLPRPLHTYASLRRAIFAGVIVAKHLSPHTFSDRIKETLRSIAADLMRVHVLAAHNRSGVEHLHISKAKGTRICKLAGLNLCSTEEFEYIQNCRIRAFQDEPIWTDRDGLRRDGSHVPLFFSRTDSGPQRLTCEERAALLSGKGFNFFSNERFLLGGALDPVHAAPCRQFLSVVVLRHPLVRLAANIDHIHRVCHKQGVPFPVQFEHLTQNGSHYMANNYVLRTLLGEAVHGLPLGSLNQKHLQLGMAKLSMFDVLAVLGERDSEDLALRYGLGWTQTLSVWPSNDLSPERSQTLWARALERREPSGARRYEALNELDMRLFMHSMLLNALDVVFYGLVEAARAHELAQLSHVLWEVEPVCGYMHKLLVMDTAAQMAEAQLR